LLLLHVWCIYTFFSDYVLVLRLFIKLVTHDNR